MRDYKNQRSLFCNKSTALKSLDNIARNGKYKYLILSYNSEGIMSSEEIIEVLSKYGIVELIKFKRLRFKSNNSRENKNKKYVQEHLYIYIEMLGKNISRIEEYSKILGFSSERIRRILKMMQEPVSLSTPVGEEDSRFEDFIED
jgi:hypothetical protein